MEDGTYTLKELSDGLGFAEWYIKDTIRAAFPNPTLRFTDCLYQVTRTKNKMFQVTYVGP
jgi:hypothetical protein